MSEQQRRSEAAQVGSRGAQRGPALGTGLGSHRRRGDVEFSAASCSRQGPNWEVFGHVFPWLLWPASSMCLWACVSCCLLVRPPLT